MAEKTYQVKGRHSKSKKDTKDRSEYNKKDIEIDSKVNKSKNEKSKVQKKTTKKTTKKVNKKVDNIEKENTTKENEQENELLNIYDKEVELEKQKEELDVIKEEIKTESKLPMEELKKVYKSSFIKAVCGIIALVYFAIINVLFVKMDISIYIRTLNVLGIIELLVTLIVFEIAYKKENDKLALTGIEIMFLAISSLIAIYTLKNYISVYKYIITIMGLVFPIYYMGKMIISLIKQKKEIRMELIKKNKEETR